MPPQEPAWAAVVVNYEAGDLLTACVTSLLADDSAGPPEIVVVDNGSRDGSVSRLQAAHPDVAVVVPGHNLGYAAAANIGIAATSAPVVVVCNPDLEVAPGAAATALARFAAEPDLAALGPRIVNPDGTQYPSARRDPGIVDSIGHAAFGLVVPRNRFTRRYRELDADPARPRDVDWLSGAMLFLRRAALTSVGGWDERYFMYCEDLDLCWRLRRLGWRVAYEPGGRAVHLQGASTARAPYRMIVEHHRSAYRFASRRWHGARRLLLVPAAVVLTVRAAAEITARAFGRARAGHRSAGNLPTAMPQSRTRSRAAMRSKYRKPKRRRNGSTAWMAATIAIVIVLSGVLVLTVLDRNSTSGANTAPKYADQATGQAGDHWHTYFAVNVCGEWLDPMPKFEKPWDNANGAFNAGLHSHGDGFIHTHPFQPSEGGSNATVAKFFDYGGWTLTADSIDLGGASSDTTNLHGQWKGPASDPKQTKWQSGDTCPFGQYKGEKVEMTWYVDGKQMTGNPADYHQQNGETIAVYFLPKGAEKPFPPNACTAFENISDSALKVLSKNSPCRAVESTTTTVPGDTTTTAPATTSTP